MFKIKESVPTSSSEMEVVELKPQAENVTEKVSESEKVNESENVNEKNNSMNDIEKNNPSNPLSTQSTKGKIVMKVLFLFLFFIHRWFSRKS